MGVHAPAPVHAGDGLYSFTVREGYEEPLPAKWAKVIYGRLE